MTSRVFLLRLHFYKLRLPQCSKSCGGGIKTRVVECKQVMAQNHVVSRPESQCPSVKPQDRRPCNTKQCPSEEQNPTIAVANITYIQHNASKKKVNLKIGGQAQVFYGTQVKIKCPVKKFNRSVDILSVYFGKCYVLF